jgi:hypothetical protein
MGHVDQALLAPYLADGLLGAEVGRDAVLEEEPADLPVPGADLLAHDHLEGGHPLDGLGPVHLVVVGHGDAVDALADAGLDEMLGLEQAVVAVPGVAVQVQAQALHGLDSWATSQRRCDAWAGL